MIRIVSGEIYAGKCEMTVASDEDIITATLRGDIASFGTLVERHWNMVVALALSRIADPAEKISLPPWRGQEA